MYDAQRCDASELNKYTNILYYFALYMFLRPIRRICCKADSTQFFYLNNDMHAMHWLKLIIQW